MVGVTFIGIPTLGLKALLFIFTLIIPLIHNHPTYADFLPYCLPIPAFLAIVLADRLDLVDQQNRFGNRAFLACVGGAAGGMTTVAFYGAPMLTQPGALNGEWRTFSLLTIMFSGAPAGMVLGAVMARSTIDRWRLDPSAPKR